MRAFNMKTMAVVGVFICVGLVLADTELPARGCIWALGKCVRECEEGTHSYSPKGGCGFLTPEATCEEPNPQSNRGGMICDFSACYCDPPTVRDTVSKKCMELADCGVRK